MCGFDEVPHIAGYLKAALTPRSTYTIFFFFFWINLYSGFTDSRSSPVAVHVLLQLGDRSYVKGAPPFVRIN